MDGMAQNQMMVSGWGGNAGYQPGCKIHFVHSFNFGSLHHSQRGFFSQLNTFWQQE